MILINIPPIKEVYNSIYEMKVDKILDINEEKYLKTIDDKGYYEIFIK